LKRSPGAGLHAHIVFTDRAVYVEKGERIDYLRRLNGSRTFDV